MSVVVCLLSLLLLRCLFGCNCLVCESVYSLYVLMLCVVVLFVCLLFLCLFVKLVVVALSFWL